MKQSVPEKIMKGVVAISAVSTILSCVFYQISSQVFLFVLAITFGTVCYHFSMRMILGLTLNKYITKPLNYGSKWFSQKKFEAGFYQKLRIRHWKNRLPTYYPGKFSLGIHSELNLIQTMCIAEIGHEMMILLSYIPILFSLFFGQFYVFLITSFLAGLCDAAFVTVQRYNRFRIVKIVDREYDKTSDRPGEFTRR